MVKRARNTAKATSKSKTAALVPAQVMLFGAPHLLEDEDAAAYDVPASAPRQSRSILSMRCSSSTWWPWSGRFCGGAA